MQQTYNEGLHCTLNTVQLYEGHLIVFSEMKIKGVVTYDCGGEYQFSLRPCRRHASWLAIRQGNQFTIGLREGVSGCAFTKKTTAIHLRLFWMFLIKSKKNNVAKMHP